MAVHYFYQDRKQGHVIVIFRGMQQLQNLDTTNDHLYACFTNVNEPRSNNDRPGRQDPCGLLKLLCWASPHFCNPLYLHAGNKSN